MATILATRPITRELVRCALSCLAAPQQPSLLATAADVAALPPGGFPEIIAVGNLRTSDEAQRVVDIAGREKMRLVYLSGSYERSDPAFDQVTKKFPPRPCVLINGGPLATPNVRIRTGRSWERLAGDLVLVLADFPNMTVYTHLIVILGASGAISFSFDPETYGWTRRLYYHPRRLPAFASAADAENLADFISAGIIVRAHGPNDYIDFACGVASGLTAAAKKASGEPLDAVAPELSVSLDARIEAKTLPLWVKLPEWWEPSELHEDWTILQACYPFDYNAQDLALSVIAKGPQEAFWNVPLLEIGDLVSVDKREIDVLTELQAELSDYVTTPNDRPYNIAVLGSPGSGKSFAVTEIAKSIAKKFEAHGITIPPLEFNLTQISSEDELASKFKAVEDACSPTTIPLVFWNEFDRQYGVKPFGWLEKFISPMYTGKYTLKGADRAFGRVIFVFAGGTQENAEKFRETAKGLPPESKGTDFVQRLKFYIDIPTIRHPGHKEYDNFAMIRRAMLVRSTLQRKKREFLARAVAANSPVIDPGVANALLKTTEYKAGARSIETIITACDLSAGDCLGATDLPDNTVLGAHVDLHEFHDFRFEIRGDWETVMPQARGWRARYEEDHRYTEWREAQAKKSRL